MFSTKQLYEQVWNNLFDLGGENTVTVHINTLRKKWERWDQRSSRLCGALAISLSHLLIPNLGTHNEWNAKQRSTHYLFMQALIKIPNYKPFTSDIQVKSKVNVK